MTAGTRVQSCELEMPLFFLKHSLLSTFSLARVLLLVVVLLDAGETEDPHQNRLLDST